MLLGLLEPSRGSARVLGHDTRSLPHELRARVGYLAEGHWLPRWMRVGDLERFQSGSFPRWSGEIFQSVVRHFRLDARSRAGDLSRGERAGLCLALALAPEPELLILDDPATGLDPVARRSLLEAMVYVTREAGRTILFSSHLISDVERVADQMAILDEGALKVQCSVETFRSRVRQFVLRYPGDPPQPPAIPGVLQAVRGRSEIRLMVANATDGILAGLQGLGASSVEEVPLGFEDACIGFLGARGERSFFLSDIGASSREEEET